MKCNEGVKMRGCVVRNISNSRSYNGFKIVKNLGVHF